MRNLREKIRAMLPEDLESFPPYLFDVLENAGTADIEAGELEEQVSALSNQIVELTEENTRLKEENMRLFFNGKSAEEKETEKEEEEEEGVKSLEDVLKEGVELS